MNERQKAALRQLPKIDELLLVLERKGLLEKAPRPVVIEACRNAVGDIRKAVLSGTTDVREGIPPLLLDRAVEAVSARLDDLSRYSLRRVINATGVILHTNLGRAPLCREAILRVIEVSRGYSNLEFNLKDGRRGLRYDHVQGILCELTGAESALVVNNNAAAVLLVLNTLSAGKEAIVSRGELVAIGGEFRIPDVMEKSGAVLREVGTTNRTHLSDYEKAIHADTGMILKVHTSNYRIVGFTEEAELPALVELGIRNGIPVMSDLGSGCLIPLDEYGLAGEPTIGGILETGVDVVTFSGDKLLGGPQAGIILGKKDILDDVKKNPLNRALRIDKLTLAALEATMKLYLNRGKALAEIRSLKALTEPSSGVAKRGKRLLDLLRKMGLEGWTFSLKEGLSMAGGGALPLIEIPTVLISIRSTRLSASRLDERFRSLDMPIVARISEEEILFDLRTIDAEEFPWIRSGLKKIAEIESEVG
jgi:L-seryl-tRNA(Ser) seleniumtransferase